MIMNEKIVSIEELFSDVPRRACVGEGFRVITTEQSIDLTINSFHQCCEEWGYFWCQDNPNDFIGASLVCIDVVDDCLNKKMLPKYGLDEGGMMCVNIETDRGTLQFVAYNAHNGYYGHEAKVVSKSLNHKVDI
jgi:hypothetical protein